MRRAGWLSMLAWVLILAVAVPAVSAQTIRVLHRPDEGGNIELFTRRFEQETGINVEITYVGWAEIHDKTIVALTTGGGGYDVIFVPSASAQEYPATGTLMPLNDLVTAETRSEWLPNVLDLYTYEGDLIAVPWYLGGAHMVYNAEHLQAAGVNPDAIRTWEDLLEAAAAIKEAGAVRHPFAPSAKYPGNWYYNWGTMVYSVGGRLFDDAGNPVINSDPGVRYATEVLERGSRMGLFDPAGVAMDDYETLVNYMAGNSSFLIDSTWSVNQTNLPDQSLVAGHSEFILIPGGLETRTGGLLYAGGFSIPRTARNVEAAKRYITYLTGAEAQKHHAIEGKNLPTRAALYEDPEIAGSLLGFDLMGEQVAAGRFDPRVPWFGQFRISAAEAIQDVVSGRRSAQEALDWLQGEALRMKQEHER